MNLRRTILSLAAALPLLATGQVIPVETDALGLYLAVGSGKMLYMQYLGEKIATPQQILLDYDNNTPNMKNVEGEAYPPFGNGNTNEPALLVTHADGNLTSILRYESHSQSEPQPGVRQVEVRLRDPLYPLQVTLFYRAYLKENVIEAWSVVRHTEKGAVKLERFASACLTLKSTQYRLQHFWGSWSTEMTMVEEQLTPGIKLIESKKGIRTTQSESPSFVLTLGGPATETSGEAVLGTLAWSGNYRLAFQVDNQNVLQILPSINDFASDYMLDPATDFTTPKFIFTYSNTGVGQGSRNLHRWARTWGMRGGDELRDVVLNSWEGAYFDFDEGVIKNMIDDAAVMGAETFVMDDGWFGGKFPRNNDKQGLGDWQVNRKKLPGGLKALVDHAHAKGLKFGLWFEPEMVNPKSELAARHPEWIVGGGGREPILWRNQLLLDLSNPAVQDFVYHAVADVLKANPGIDYVKWDANRHVENLGSSFLSADRQSHFWIEYIRGLYGVYAKLSKEFPKVVFQACSAGGGRVDYGSLAYHHEFWASDNTDALSRIFINWGYSQIFPAIAVGTHVSVSPNHQTKHVTPIKFRFDVAMAGRLGIELQPQLLTPEELDWAQKAVAAYKGFREVVQQGDQYRLISPYEGTQRASLMYVSPDKARAVLFAWCLGYHHREFYPIVKLQGLDPAKNYRVTEVLPALSQPGRSGKGGGREVPAFAANGQTFSGDFLMKYGMRVLVRYTYESAVFELTEVK